MLMCATPVLHIFLNFQDPEIVVEEDKVSFKGKSDMNCQVNNLCFETMPFRASENAFL